MKSFTIATALAVANSVLAAPNAAEPLFPRATSLPAITIKGNAFFSGNDRFFMRGIDYQPGGSSNLVDPLADGSPCARDIAMFKSLGVNTVRIYTVDNSANHDTCMQALADAGIYLVLDVNSPLYSINRADPHASYNQHYLQNVFATIDKFAGYSNTLAFFSGNEVINDASTTAAAPYVKATTRDMRQYIGSRGYRKIPVGYSAADVNENRMEMAHYMNCGTDDQRSDFFAFNDYAWCDPSTFETSGYSIKVKNFTGYGLPIFLSEFGCIKPGPRLFEEVKAIFSTQMSAVYSGGLAYEYSWEKDNPGYGLGNITSTTVYTPGDQFTILQKQYVAAAKFSGDNGYSSTSAASTCPPSSSTWNVTSNALPAIPAVAATYMTNGAGAGVGLKGPGSQTAGGTSTTDASPGSGSVTAVASATSGSATKTGGASASYQPFDKTPVALSAIVLVLTAFGATLL